VYGPPILHSNQVFTTFELVPVLGFAEPSLLGCPPAGLDAGWPRAIALALVHARIDAKATTAVLTFPMLLFFGY
jgi:hypothetical protein